MPTAWKRFRRTLPASRVEWVLSIAVLAIGFLWLIFPGSFTRPEMAQFLDIASARAWTATMVMIGLLSCVGLASYAESPRMAGLLRSAMSVARCTVWGAFLGRSFASSDWFSVSIGVILYSAFLFLDGPSVWRSWSETFNAFRKVRPLVPITSVVR